MPGQEKAQRILSDSLSCAQITGIFDKLSQVRAWTNLKSGTPGIYNVGKESSLTAEKLEKIVVDG